MSDRERLKDWLLSAGVVPNTSVSVFDLKPGEFMEPPEEYVRDSDDHSIMFGDGHGYRGTYFTFDFDEAGKYVGTQFLGVGVKKPGEAGRRTDTMSGWRPIATAPKDGTWILTWDGSEITFRAWGDPGERNNPGWHDAGGFRPLREDRLKMWRPLPPPPGEAKL